MDKGTLVEIRLNGSYRLMVIEGTEGKKHLQAIDDNGILHTVHPREIEYAVPGSFTNKQIPQFAVEVQPYLDPSQLEVAWEILQDAGELTTPQNLAELLFTTVNAATCYAAYSLLRDDKLFFKQKGQAYEPRSASQVADLKHQLLAAQQRAQETEVFTQKILDKLQNKDVVWTTAERQKLEALERFALRGDETTDKDKFQAQEILTITKRLKSDGAAFDLLVGLGIWHIHENLALRRSQITADFPPEVLELVAERLENPPPDPIERLDLRHLHVYTIDDISTTEIDDGVSIDRDCLWIHIADPTRWVIPGDRLELEARKRGTSIYLPTGMIPMFPPALSTGPMSLVQGKDCCALSFAVQLNESGAIVTSNIHATIIRPTYRLTYDDVNEMLELGAEADLDRIFYWAKQRQLWRNSQGAIAIHLPETVVKANTDSDQELILQVQENSPARQLVSEMMVLANEVAARFAQENEIAIPFRAQPAPQLPEEEELARIPAGPARAWALCRTMSRSEVSIQPATHSGLGLKAYTQATSPIRRYGDLIVHYQIKAFLQGITPLYSINQVQDLIAMIDGSTSAAIQIERQTNRYWSLEYLRRYSQVVWQAIFLDWWREHEKLGLVLLEENGLKLPIKLTRQVSPGDLLQIRVSQVNPRLDIIYFQEVGYELRVGQDSSG